jgi:RNA polymerase sigma-70 factor (sigma-E family)
VTVTRPAGDGPDFEEFVAARGRSLFRTAHLLVGEKEAAEDLLQSVFEKAYPRWWRIRRAGQPEAYVRRMLVNQAHDTWRARKGVHLQAWVEEQIEAHTGEGGFGPLRGADPAEEVVLRQTLMKAVRTLPAQMQAVLVLRYWEGLAEREAAELLGVSVGSVKSQASRGLERLRVLMGKDGSGPGPAAGGFVGASRER